MLRSPQTWNYLNSRYGILSPEEATSDGLRAVGDRSCIAATDQQTGIEVVVRIARATDFKPEGIYRFQTESEILSTIECDSFLKPLEWGQDDGNIYGVRQALPASGPKSLLELKEIAKAGQGMPLEQVFSIACDLLEALKQIHQSGCVYRNVCRSRILVDHSRAWLICPGPEDYLESGSSQSADFLELAKFASPERSGSIEHDIGPASDLYSIGVLLFTLLSGRAPFRGDTVGAVLFQHIAIDPDFGLLGPDVPPIANEIIARLLRKEPRDRYQSADAALADIRQVTEAVRHGRPVDRFVIGRQDTRNSIIEPAFVGRASELAELDHRLTEVSDGESQRLAILCPSGIGKSRIVLETIRLATHKGFGVYRSLASNQASEIPTAPLRSIVEQLVSQVRLCERLRTRLQEQLGDFQEDIASAFPDLTTALGWPKSASADLEELGKARLEATFCQIFASLGDSERPAFVWIDDCQWLDTQSLGIIEKLQAIPSHHCLFIFSMRPDEGISETFCDRIATHLAIRLDVFDNDEIQAMIESMAGRLPVEAVVTVVKLAAGSPFMASAILRGMAESGALHASANGWQIDSDKLQKIQASANAAEALLNRLENVPQNVLRQLSFAAIIGKEFDEKTVFELSPIPLKDSKACFDWSRQQRLIWSMPNGNYTFVHDKIRETLIARLSADERKQIHLVYAEYLKQFESECSFELAYHYHSADSYSEALPYALQAAETARRLHSLDRAEELMRIALHGLEFADRKTRHLVQAGLADVLMLAGKYDEAEQWFEASLETVDSSLDMAKIGLKRGELAFKRGDKEQAVKLFSAALGELEEWVPSGSVGLWRQLLREISTQVLHSVFPKVFLGTRGGNSTEADRLSWRLHSRIAHGYWYTRDKFHVLWAHLRGMNLSERYAPTHEMAQAYSEHAPAMSLIPWHSRGIQYVKRSLAIREKLNDIWGQGQSRNFYSILLYSSSQFETCIRQASHAESILLRTGDYWEVNIARYQLAASMYRMGDLKGALEVARRTYDSALAIGDFQSTGNIIDVWVRAAMCEIPDELLAVEKTRTLRDRQGECQVLLAEGIQFFGKKRYAEAASNFDKAIAIAEKAGVVNTFITPNYPWRATALRMAMQVNPPKSRQAKQRGLKNFCRAARKAVRVSRSFQNDLPHALREFGAANGLMGRAKSANRALLESMAVARIQKADYELALTQRMYGEVGQEYDWQNAEEIGRQGQARIQEIRQPVRQSGHRESMSLFDRFDTLLEAGRQIISANSSGAIFEKTIEATKRLLRGQRTLLIESDTTDGNNSWRTPDASAGFDLSLVNKAAESRRTVVVEQELVHVNGQPVRHSGTFLCCPVTVHEKVVACLYVANEFLAGLFGKNEIRIADYLASAAGGALEKADGFQQLEQLNVSLENKVLERTAAVEARSRELQVTANELIATQSKLEQARDEAESANAAKSDFLARMSHEIRTPISAILGFTELMLRGVIRDPQDSVRKLETIQTNGSHLLQLINDLLDLSKIEADKMEVESIDCNPAHVIQDVVTSLQVRADQKTIGLETRIDGHVPRIINSDPTRLRQILINLIGNAIKFTSRGQVVITMRLLKPDQSQPDGDEATVSGQLEFDIADSGIGMTPSQLERIFNPFTQADSTVTRDFGGTGLGLSISKQLAEALGGGVSVSSKPGVGSTFTVRIDTGRPLASLELLDSAAARKFLARDAKKQCFRANLAGCHILVVDDVEANRELLSLFLKDAGATVKLAVDGLEAVDNVTGGGAFDLVLMDMQMPVLDGYSAARILRQKGFDMPIIALTANTMNGDENKCLDAGCSDYLSKPVDINSLMKKVSEIHGVELVEVEHSLPAIVALPFRGAGKQVPSVAGPASVSAVDPKWLDKLPADEPFRSFALKFVEKVENSREKMALAMQTGDFEELARIAHWIKGTGGTVGLDRMTEIANSMEEALRNRRLDDASVFVDRIWSNIEHVKSVACC